MIASATAQRSCELVVLIPDGAAEPGTSTSLSRAATPHLDALTARQGVGALRVIPPGWHPGTETGVARLLGLALTVPPSRGWLDAAALGLDVPARCAAWRLDVNGGGADRTRIEDRFKALTGTSEVAVAAIDKRRHVLIGPARWGDAAAGHDQPMPPSWRLRLAPIAAEFQVGLHAWGTAARPQLAASTDLAVRPASGAVHGLARLAGCEVLPGRPTALERILAGGARTVVVHDAAPDEAAHARDIDAKIAALERFDTEVVGPAVSAALAVGARVVVAPDHGCDPATGRHTSEPVPATWPGAPGHGRLTEHAVQGLAPTEMETMFAASVGDREFVA